MTGVQDRTPITHGLDIEAMQKEREGVKLEDETIALEVDNLDLYYGQKRALNGVSMKIAKNKATAFIGPSGCG